LPAHPASAADIAQARYITSSQFLRSFNQVSLTVRASGDELDKYMSGSQAREIVQDVLAKSGVVVRANSPVALEVRLMHRPYDWKLTRTLFVNGIPNDRSVETFQVHFLSVSLHYYVRGAVMRNNKFHSLPVAAASGWWLNNFVEPNEAQRDFQGINTRDVLHKEFSRGVQKIIEEIGSETDVDNTPWPPATWTENEKAQKNADFASVMRAAAPMDQSLILGLDVQPRLTLNSRNLDPGCVVDSDWRNLWTTTFQRLKWTRPQAQPTVTVEHRVDCQRQELRANGEFFRVVSTVHVSEANALFELNGEVVRKRSTLLFSEGFASREPRDSEIVRLGFSGEVLGRFNSALDRGTRDAPRLPGSELAVIAGTAKTPPIGRVILGEDVRLEQGTWRYANGRSVPDTLLDKATGGPPLRPKSQRPVTQAPVSTHVADIKAAFGAVKSCQLYTSASRDNLLWSVISPAFELDDTGVIASRYVLSTRPGQGYAHGAAIANLSLVDAQIQDRGGCKVVIVPCKTGQCVRFEENANPSLTFFVETSEQANRILNALRAIAPFYPSGAGELRGQ